LDLIGLDPLLLQKLQKFGRQVEDPPLPVLRCARVKPDLTDTATGWTQLGVDV
jgi:hypothetical protein